MSQPNSDSQISRGAGLQPLLHPQARRARSATAEKPVLAERGAGAVRDSRTGKTWPPRKSGSNLASIPAISAGSSRISTTDGLITRKPLASDRRQYRLSLTAKGRRAFDKLDRSSHDDVAAMLAALPDGGRERLIGAMAVIERPARRIRPLTSACYPARPAPGRHGMGGAEPWCALCPRIRLRFLVRRPGRGDRSEISRPRSTPRASAAGSPNSTAPRSARYFWSGTATMSPNCGCCWSIRPGADMGLGQRLVAECVGFARPAAIAKSRCGPRASWSPRARFIRTPDSCWLAPSRTAVSARA